MITSKYIIRRLSKQLSEEISLVKVSSEVARKVGDLLNVDWSKVSFDEFHQGIQVEFEHGDENPKTDVISGPDSSLTSKMTAAKIALAHLNELPDYYTRLAKMENE